jgi:hypothetical protein
MREEKSRVAEEDQGLQSRPDGWQGANVEWIS